MKTYDTNKCKFSCGHQAVSESVIDQLCSLPEILMVNQSWGFFKTDLQWCDTGYILIQHFYFIFLFK